MAVKDWSKAKFFTVIILMFSTMLGIAIWLVTDTFAKLGIPDPPNLVTIVIEIGVGLFIGYIIFMYSTREQKRIANLINDVKTFEDKQTQQMEKIESLTAELEKMISKQNETTVYNKKLTLSEIIKFFTELQIITEYFIENIEEKFEYLSKLCKIDPSQKRFQSITKKWQFQKETGFDLPREDKFEEISYLLESTKNLFNQDDVISTRKILKNFKERYYSYDTSGNLMIVSKLKINLAIIDLKELKNVTDNLKKIV